MNPSTPYVAVKTQFPLKKSYRLFPWNYAPSSYRKTQNLASSPGTDYIVPILIVASSWGHLKADYPFPESNVPTVLYIPVLDVRNQLTLMKDVASVHSKHSPFVKSGKRVLVATLLWSSTKDVTTSPVSAKRSFVTYVLHLGRLVHVRSEMEEPPINGCSVG